MKDYYNKAVGAYVCDVHVAASRAVRYAIAVSAGWLAFPFVLQTVLNPTDAVRLQLKVQGLSVPHVFTAQQAASGLVEAVFALTILVCLQLICTALFYRRAQMAVGSAVATPALWPIAALLPGVIGNGVWWFITGAFDPGGGIVGWSAAALTVGIEFLCNRLGRNFVMGGAHSSALPLLQ